MKSKPTYSLEEIKKAFSCPEKLNMTYSALKGEDALGFSDEDVIDAIQALSKSDFYKSMPPINPNFSAWQDVYKPYFRGFGLYIKFQINERSELILSFKEK